MWDRIKRSNAFIKVTNWEYWPFMIVYWPVVIYWLWLSFKARSFFYFTASNPGIKNGGMLGESKWETQKLLPRELLPVTVFIPRGSSFDEVKALLKEHNLAYPVVAKPDVGERGWWVEKIVNDDSLRTYSKNVPVDYIIQEYLNMPLEYGIFYYRIPDEPLGLVTSIVQKEMLSVEGDGILTLEQLIKQKERASLQYKKLKVYWKSEWDRVPGKGEKILLLDVGNHCRGALFLNANHLIDERLNKSFSMLSDRIPGFYFGRFDIRANSEEDLYTGNFKIMELNGAGAEPGHIYHPGFSIREAYKVIFHHFKILYRISVINNKKGIPYLKFSEGWKEYRRIKSYQ